MHDATARPASGTLIRNFGDTDVVAYREFAPPVALASHVACLWWRTDAPARVLPDGCVDLVWTGDELIMAGPATRAVIPKLPTAGPKLGIRFRTGAADLALRLSVGELLNSSPRLGDVWADGDELEERAAEASNARDCLGVLTDVVAQRLADAPVPDPTVRAAVRELRSPRTRIDQLCTRLEVSERKLRRRFADTVGYSPRTLARVLRLQRFLDCARHGGDLAWLAAQAGYADQPHLTRDCAQLTGLPAGALLASGARPAGERLTRA